jgi:hypothetical protein
MNLRRTGEAGVPIKIAVRKRKRSSAIFEERCGDAAGPARQAEVSSLNDNVVSHPFAVDCA